MEELRRRAALYRELAGRCDFGIARLMLDSCAKDYEAEASRQEEHERELAPAH